jgi:hypothetical protein
MEKTSSRLFVLALISVLWISACSKKDSNPVTPNSPTAIFPLAAGNQWIMQSYFYSGSAWIPTTKDTTGIKRDTTISGEKWYTMGDNTYMTNRSDGLWQFTAEDGAQLMFKYPVQVNDSFKQITGNAASGFDTSFVKVLSISQSVVVPAGTFTCVTYQLTNAAGDGIQTLQIAPGKGPVSMQFEGKNPLTGQMGPIAKSELLSYSLK